MKDLRIRIRRCCLACVVSLVLTGSITAEAADVSVEKSADLDARQADSILGQKVANFILSDAHGQQLALTDLDDKQLVVLFFTGTSCPISNLYLTELAGLGERYQQQGLQILGINSNAGTTLQALREHAEEYKIAMPVLLDAEQRIADRLKATRTAEVFLLDAERIVRYHGRVDDRFGYTYKNAQPRRRDLEEAVKEILAGEPVTVAETKPLGCLITRSKRASEKTKITYAKEISRIIQRRCHECHRPGMIGPFSLLTYDDAVKHTDMMKEVVLEGRMPPWHADPRYGHWSNSRQMPQQEVDTLVAWIDAGAPFGEERDLPPDKEYVSGWAIGQPDVVFELPEEVTVPADGVVPYLYYKVPTNFEEDVWIQAAEARPDNRAVVHHIIVFYRSQGEGVFRQRGQICGTAPGDPPLILPNGVAKKIPAGADLIFQMHYTPTGKVEKDRSQIGFVFYKGKEPPVGFAKTKGIMNRKFEIPAGAASHEVRSSFTFKQDVRLLALMPHMHLRGKDFLYTVTYPDGNSQILLSVPRYDFNWQNAYWFAKPQALPSGARIDCLAHFDNSDGNPANPDPTQQVRWGDQTWEEMMIGWIDYMPDGRDDPPSDENTDDFSPDDESADSN